MRWANIAVASAPLWLSWLGLCHGANLAESSPARRQIGPSDAGPSDDPGEFVWRADTRSPAEIRQAGGFRPRGENWHRNEAAFLIHRHYKAGPAGCGLSRDLSARPYQSAYVSFARQINTSATYVNPDPNRSTWLYEIRATPNMMDLGLPESEVLALGGVHWRQIRRYRRLVTDQNGAIVQMDWSYNPEYQRDLYEGSRYARRCRVETDIPPDLDDDWSEDEMDSMDTTRECTDDSDSDEEGNDPCPRYRSARTFVSGPTMQALVGDFPPVFEQRDPRADIPGPDDPSLDEDVIRDEVLRDLERYRDLNQEQIQEMYPEYDEMLQDILDEIDHDACSPPKRARAKLKARSGQSSDVCCKSLSEIRDLAVKQAHKNRRISATAKSAGIKPNELRHLRDGNFAGLNCSAIMSSLKKADTICPEEWPIDQIPVSSSDSPQALCKRARTMVCPGGCDEYEPRNKTDPGPVHVVFYGHYLWPEEAMTQGGFLPPDTVPTSSSNPAADWSKKVLQTHLVFGLAAKDAAEKAANATTGFHGVVYAVQATPNMLVSGMDSIAVGGIRWGQVLGWAQVPLNYTTPKHIPRRATRRQLHFQKALEANEDFFQKNNDYELRYHDLSATTDMPDFNSPNSLTNFMEKNGWAVGWRRGQSIFSTYDLVTPKASKEAKTAKAVNPPHEQSFWQKASNFIGSHKLAVALIPVVIAANLIPGIGEAADVAEVAALSADAVEGIELGEVSVGGSSELTPLLQNIAKLKIE